MKYGIVILIVVVVLLAGLIGCASRKQQSGKTEEAGGGTKPLSELKTYTGLAAALTNAEEIVVYDVRTAEEYASGHIPGSVNIPHDVIGDRIPVKDKDAVIVVYCRSGNRSGQARRTLEKLGYTNIADFGGIGKWVGDFVTGTNP
jgi:phage shock protein E